MKTLISKTSPLVAALTAAVFLSLAQPVSAQVTPAVEADPAKWETTASSGLTLTQGNSDTLLVTASILGVKKWDKNEARVGANGAYGESESVRNNEMLQAFGQYNRLWNERLYGFLRLDVVRDAIADVDYRIIFSPGIGYYLIKNDATSLSVEAGPGAIYERQGGKSTGYMTLRLAERFEHRLSERAKIWQSVEIIPEVSDFDNFLVNAELGVEAGLTKKLSLRSYLVDTYDHQPAPGRKKNDLKFVTAVVYTF